MHAAGHGPSWDERAVWYGRIADHFEPEYGKATEDMLDAVRAAPGSRILDLACGPGHTTAAATARGARALGIDTSPAMVAAARQRFPGADFAVADMRDPPSGPWDAVVSRLGAHHADPAWIEATWRVLRPGGRVAIAEFGDDDAHARENGMRDQAYWVALFQAAGLIDVSTTTRTLRLGDLAATLPPRDAERFGPHHRNRPIHIIAGRKPAPRPENGPG